MTMSSTINRLTYAGNGATTAFSFPYGFLSTGDLVVIIRVEATGVETTKVLTTHYTVSGTLVNNAYPSGGTITMLTAPATGETLTIIRDPLIVQETDLVENDSLPAETVEQTLDRLTMVSQRLKDRLDRTGALTNGYSAAFDPTLPSLIVANSVLAFNGTGTGFVSGPTSAAISSAAANAAAAAASASSSAGSATLAQDWATKTTATVDGVDYSAKEHAKGVQTRGLAGGGSAKDWATYTGGTVDNVELSAKQYALNSAASVATHAALTTGTHGVTGTIAGTSDTQVLTNKDIDGGTAADTRRITLPKAAKATLDALTRKQATIVYASDENKVYYDNGSNLLAVGSGSGGGGVNYILNPDAETNTTGYATYADAAGALPVDGTGGSPTVTLTRSTSSPLRTLANFLITKDAANRQGQGASYDFTIDRADQAKMLSITFDYEIGSGTYADGDIGMYIYDVTNAVVIQPAPYQLLKISGQGKFQAVFQSASNSTSYRLIFHVASTSALAYTMKLDNVSVGPQAIVFGAPVTDWLAYTPTFTGFGTTTNISFFYRRVGDSIQIKGNFDAGTPTGVEARIGLPAGLTSEGSSKVNTLEVAGLMVRTSSATTYFYNSMLAERSVGYLTVGQQSSTANALVKQNASDFVSSGQTMSITAMVPVTGWSSSLQISSDADTRVVAAKQKLVTGYTPAANAVIAFDSVTYDTLGAVSGGRFTAPIPGTFSVSGTIHATTGANLQLYKNGVFHEFLATYAASAITAFSTEIKLVAGDIIDVRPDAGTTALNNDNTTLSISKVSGPSAIAASEKIVTVATWTGGTATANLTIPFNTKIKDSHGSFNFATGEFTCQRAGDFLVSVYAQNSSGTQSSMAIYKNGSQYLEIATCPTGANNSYNGSAIVANCIAGDVLTMRTNTTVTISTGANVSISGI